VKRPSNIAATVAAAWATIAGCRRMIGAVTPVDTRRRSVIEAIPPRTAQTKPDCPWVRTHGWKWSEMVAAVNPAASACRA
jgi:hypothetical protein